MYAIRSAGAIVSGIRIDGAACTTSELKSTIQPQQMYDRIQDRVIGVALGFSGEVVYLISFGPHE